MKKQTHIMIAMLVLVASMSMAAKAQSGNRAQLIANIPFQFNVGDKTMPAGEYTARQVNPASDGALLQLTNRDGSAGVLVLMRSMIGKAEEQPRLVFNRYGNKYFFAEAWTPDQGFEASKCRAERATQRELSKLQLKMETVALRVR